MLSTQRCLIHPFISITMITYWFDWSWWGTVVGRKTNHLINYLKLFVQYFQNAILSAGYMIFTTKTKKKISSVIVMLHTVFNIIDCISKVHPQSQQHCDNYSIVMYICYGLWLWCYIKLFINIISFACYFMSEIQCIYQKRKNQWSLHLAYDIQPCHYDWRVSATMYQGLDCRDSR